ncbi:MAG: DUF4861 family protein [Bacteroidales bacterium]|nr:DUF4861 family protein [Bacteroidales bacterium]
MIKIILLFFLLAFLSCIKEKSVSIFVQNPTSMDRKNEMIEVDWDLIKNVFRDDKQSFIILNQFGEKIPYQFVYYGFKTPELLIFQASLKANEKLEFKIVHGEPDSIKSRVNVAFVPERKDDISWENNRIAYRMYGPALEVDPKEALVSGGIDLWVKSTPELVAAKWYKDDLAHVKSYHKDNGEGLDFYSVGKSLGAGASAPIKKDSLYYIGHNFKSYDILDNGPLRLVFKLTYQPYYAYDSIMVDEHRLISLDAGSNLNKIVENYGDIKKSLKIAAGFPYYGNDTYVINADQGYISYAQPEDSINGVIYLGLVSDVALEDTKVVNNQMVSIFDYQPSYKEGRGLTYYSGGGWNKGGYPSFKDWTNYISDFANKVRHPLIIWVE